MTTAAPATGYTIPADLADAIQGYADLLIKIGVNLQPGQCLSVRAELEHADFARLLVASAYRAGAKYVQMVWNDEPIVRARLLESDADALDFFPEYEVTRHREMMDDTWALMAIVGPAFPDLLNDVDPARMRRAQQARQRKVKFYNAAMMANRMQWCVAAVPTRAWAQQVYPDLSPAESVSTLWRTILTLVRATAPDPIAAWQAHDATLSGIANAFEEHRVRSLHLFDPTPAADGKPSTDLVIGLTEAPVWVAAASQTPAGVRFLANMPTEEVFTTPHRDRADGYVRTSKPGFPFNQRVDNARFVFKEGAVVEFDAEVGRDALEELFKIPGADHLGEIALVDVRSPVNQSGVVFYETLFDENCVVHMAFGKAYPEGIRNGNSMTAEELIAGGVNDAETHVDFMIGTPTLRVTGICADGTHLVIMENGQFTYAVTKTTA